MDATALWPDEVPDGVASVTLSVAFDEFYGRHREALARALALTLCDTDLGTEAADEAMARAYARWATVGEMVNPAGWAFRVGLNWARSSLRRLRRPAAPERPLGEPDIAEPALRAALLDLSVRHRSVVVCRYLLGYSDAETSEVLGIRPGTVRSSLARALRHLAVELDHLRDER